MTPEELGQHHRQQREDAAWDIVLSDGTGRVVRQSVVGGNVNNYTLTVSYSMERVLIYLCLTSVIITWIVCKQ